MFRRIAELDWTSVGQEWALITLTWPCSFSGDPARWKRQLSALRLRWRRRFRSPLHAMWVLEWQRPRKKGAAIGMAGPHFHLAAALPAGASVDAVSDFVRLAWNEIVAPGDPDHLAHGADVGIADVQTVPFYLAREVGKRRQKELPPEWLAGGAGRWWGIWSIRLRQEVRDLSEDEFFRLRRLLRRLARRDAKPIGGYCDVRSRTTYTALGSFERSYEIVIRYRRQGASVFSRGRTWSLFDNVARFVAQARADQAVEVGARSRQRLRELGLCA